MLTIVNFAFGLYGCGMGGAGPGVSGRQKINFLKNVTKPLFLARAPTRGHPYFGSLLEPSGIGVALHSDPIGRRALARDEPTVRHECYCK